MDIIGFDLSLTCAGWFLQDPNDTKNLTYGSFKTKPADGLIIERLIQQRERFVELIAKHNVDHIGIEQALQHTFSTELLFALHQFILEICLKQKINVVYITPAQIKQYVTGNHLAQKNEIMFKTRQVLNLTTQKMNNDESDAYWVSVLAKKFWQLYYKETAISDLTPLGLELVVYYGLTLSYSLSIRRDTEFGQQPHTGKTRKIIR